MRLRTLLALLGRGQIGVPLRAVRALRAYHRLAYLAAGASSGVFARLATGPRSCAELAQELDVDPNLRDGLEAWLELGTGLGVLVSRGQRYGLRRLARALADPTHDAVAALLQEGASLHQRLIMEAPGRWRTGRRFTLADQDGPLVARSSRTLEPLVCEAVDDVVPRRGRLRLLEVGCGSAVYIRHAAARNPSLTALGLELQPAVAALAAENVRRWNLADRVTIEVGDVMQRTPHPGFDLVTLHNNINYFPAEARAGVLRHAGAFLEPGGRLLVTILCGQRGGSGAVLDLWGAMTEGCGRLPTRAELTGQLAASGFTAVESRSLAPGLGFYAFAGVRAQ